MSTLLNIEPVAYSEQIAGNVRAIAAMRGLNQTSLARELGAAQSAINMKWRGKRQWQLEDLQSVAIVLGVSPWTLTSPLYENWVPR